jgi:hypothetical protein
MAKSISPARLWRALSGCNLLPLLLWQSISIKHIIDGENQLPVSVVAAGVDSRNRYGDFFGDLILWRSLWLVRLPRTNALIATTTRTKSRSSAICPHRVDSLVENRLALGATEGYRWLLAIDAQPLFPPILVPHHDAPDNNCVNRSPRFGRFEMEA